MPGLHRKQMLKDQKINHYSSGDQIPESDSDSDSSAATKSIKEAEAKLCKAIQFTEKRTGSLLVFQEATKDNIDELGRQVSSLSADYGLKDDSSVASSLRSEPLFIKVDRCDPSILKQISWEVMSGASENEKVKGKKTPSSLAKKKSQRSPNRKWDKLRNQVNENEGENNQRKVKVPKRKIKFFRRKPPKGEKGNSPSMTLETKSNTIRTINTEECQLTGESLEVVAYSSPDGKFGVLPPFPSKMMT
jgi:hypothetical protein